MTAQKWSERWGSNPHGARRQALNLLCIPIPPRSDIPTIWVRASESNRLSPAYETGMVYVSVPLARIIYVWYWRRDLNSRHTRCKRAVLPLNYSSINRCYSIVKLFTTPNVVSFWCNLLESNQHQLGKSQRFYH